MGTKLRFVLIAASFACAPAPDVDHVARGIIGGIEDSTDAFPSVVRIEARRGFCSGTLVSTAAPDRGFVLTAAHCVAAAGSDQAFPHAYATADLVVSLGATPGGATLPVTAIHMHPALGLDRFEVPGSTDAWPTALVWDHAILEVSGVDGLPISLSPPLSRADDTLEPSAPLTAVGYGITDPESGADRRRRYAAVVVDTIAESTRTGAELIVQDASGGTGTCFGDSGGPLLTATQQVAGVTSAVTSELCDEFALAGRTSQVEGWMEDVLAGEPEPEPTGCRACMVAASTSTCAGVFAADRQSASFGAACARASGIDRCRAEPMFDEMFRAYDRLHACVDAACPSCFAELRPTWECDYAQDGGDCDACLYGSCCAEIWACRHDDGCSDCVSRTDADPEACAQQPLYTAVRSCVATSCNAECGAYFDRMVPWNPDLEIDAGTTDAGTRDGGVAIEVDAGTRVDAGTVDSGAAPDPVIEEEEDGCACRDVATSRERPLGMGWLVLACGLAWRRRRGGTP